MRAQREDGVTVTQRSSLHDPISSQDHQVKEATQQIEPPKDFEPQGRIETSADWIDGDWLRGRARVQQQEE